MNETPLLTLENTIVTWQKKKAQQHVINLSSDFDEDKKQARNENKRLIIVCCEETAIFFEEALRIGMSETDLKLFLKAFYSHEFANCQNWLEKSTGKFEEKEWVKEAWEASKLLSSKDLSDNFLNNLLNDFLEFNGDSWAIMHHSLAKKIKKIKKKQAKKEVSNKGKPISNSEFTTARQLLAIYYLLEFSKVDFQAIDRTELARFSQFLTGRSQDAKKIQDTNLYKRWGALFHETEKRNRKDLQFIKGYFERVGLSEIVRLIENDMEKDEI